MSGQQLKLFDSTAMVLPVPEPGTIVMVVIRSEDMARRHLALPTPAPAQAPVPEQAIAQTRPASDPVPAPPGSHARTAARVVAEWLEGKAGSYAAEVVKDSTGRVAAFPAPALSSYLGSLPEWRGRSPRSLQIIAGVQLRRLGWQVSRPQGRGSHRPRWFNRPWHQ